VIDAPIRDGVEVLKTADGRYPAIDPAAPPAKAPGSPKSPNLWIVEMADRHPADPINCWLLHEEGNDHRGRCRQDCFDKSKSAESERGNVATRAA
jgi:hypothetical protein